jgi:molecular chaperone DnaK
VTDAVITVPAYFDDAPRRATIDAGAIAGLNARRILNEPTAAALAYGMRGDRDGLALVYDLGGGTFDVTVLRIIGGQFQVKATFGGRNLGGFDFDNALMQLLSDRFVKAGGRLLLDGDEAEATLREKAETAKHTLTSATQARVMLAADGFASAVTITRAEFEDVTSALLSRTRDLAQMVVDESGYEWDELDRLLLAGGSTRMPMVRTILEHLGRRARSAPVAGTHRRAREDGSGPAASGDWPGMQGTLQRGCQPRDFTTTSATETSPNRRCPATTWCRMSAPLEPSPGGGSSAALTGCNGTCPLS